MNDDRCRDTVNDTDLVDDGREVGPDDHRETFVEVEDPNRVCIRLQDVLVTHTVLARAFRDDRIIAHISKLPCSWPPCKVTCAVIRTSVHRYTNARRMRQDSASVSLPKGETDRQLAEKTESVSNAPGRGIHHRPGDPNDDWM